MLDSLMLLILIPFRLASVFLIGIFPAAIFQLLICAIFDENYWKIETWPKVVAMLSSAAFTYFLVRWRAKRDLGDPPPTAYRIIPFLWVALAIWVPFMGKH